MSSLPAIGTGSVSFVDANGKQHEVPLSLITFGANGAPTLSPTLSNYSLTLTPLLNALVQQGLLQPGPAPAPIPLFTVKALQSGSQGNSISITFANPAPSATPPVIDVSVTATQVYPNLSLSSIGTVLGTAPGAGTMPGLAYLSSAAPPTVMPSASSTTFSASGPVYTANIPSSGSGATTAFTLETANTNVDTVMPTAQISSVNTSASTFTLTLSWTNSVPAVSLASLTALTNALTNDFNFLLTFNASSGAPATFPPPAVGTVTLTGGVDGAGSAAVPATATVASG
ncbi:MAG: hypothetical protein ACLQO1_07260 [Steroidobacteraceae bacterium]